LRFLWLSSGPPGTFWDSASNIRPQPLPSTSIFHLSPLHSKLCCLSRWKSVVK